MEQFPKFIKSQFNEKFVNYLVYLPYFKQEKAPLLVFLHGAGEKAKHDAPMHSKDLQELKKHGPPKLIEAKEWDENLPFIVVSVQCFKGCSHHWPEVVDEVIEEVKKTWPVDEKRIYMSGISMGGNGVMRYLACYPGKAAAAVSIAGWGAGNWGAYNRTAWWGIHNRGDEVVSSLGSTQAYEKLKSTNRQAPTKLTIFEREGHDAWTKTYNLENGLDIYSFMLEQSL